MTDLKDWIEKLRDQKTATCPADYEERCELAHALSALEKERDEARAGMAYVLDHAEYGDSYGVQGSDFTACHFCHGGGAPGVPMEHEASCPVARYPEAVSEWLAEIADNEARAQAAETELSALKALVGRMAEGLEEVTGSTDGFFTVAMPSAMRHRLASLLSEATGEGER